MTSGRKHAVSAGLPGFVLILFQLVLVARAVVDWVGVLSPATAGGGLYPGPSDHPRHHRARDRPGTAGAQARAGAVVHSPAERTRQT